MTGLLACAAGAFECPNQGIVQGTTACAQADACSNHTSEDSCTTAKTWEYISKTGTVQNHYIDTDNDLCTTDVDCYWDVFCNVADDGDGETHNALVPEDSPTCS